MNLHQNKDLFADAITATAQDMDILEVYVEKGLLGMLCPKTDF